LVYTNGEVRCGVRVSIVYRVGQKSKLLILSKYVNKSETIG